MDKYQWLLDFRAKRKLKNWQIAEMIEGITAGGVANWISRHDIPDDAFNRLLEYDRAHPLEIDDSEIISKSVKSDLTHGDSRVIIKSLEETLKEGEELLKTLYSQTVKLPLVGSVPAADFERQMAETTEYFEVPVEHAGDANAVAIVSGDCMSPTLLDGDKVTIRYTSETHPGQIVLVRNGEGEVTLKRYSLIKGIASLVPDNPAYAALAPKFGTIVAVVLGIVMRRF